MNPLQSARDAISRTWFKSKRGTVRTARWVGDGIGAAFGRTRQRIGGSGDGDERAPTDDSAATEEAPGRWERTGGGLLGRARRDQRVAIALAAAAILVVAWIGWTIYVWTENGSTAGVGVLVSWPAVLLALALVAAPFVVAAVLIRRLAADGGPSLAIAGGGSSTETAAGKAEGPEADADVEESAEEDEDADEEEAEDEEAAEEGEEDSRAD